MTEVSPSSTTPEFVVETHRRLSESTVWKLQRDFYAQEGPRAWKPKGVPNYVTNNPFLARAYARLVAGFLRDLLQGAAAGAALDSSQPLYVVELAAGTGRFAYLFLNALAELRDALPVLRPLRIRYVVTDFAESNLEAARRHERLRPFADEGLLDFARYDLERDGEMTLLESGARLAPGTVANPMVAIANYAFDSIVQDMFCVKGGVLHESLVALVSSRPDEDMGDPATLERLQFRWERRRLASTDYYDDPVLNRVLAGYATFKNTAFGIPIGAVRSLRTLLSWSAGRLLLICGDKGFLDEPEMTNLREPPLGTHGGSFSLSVNLHALARYLEELGGEALLPSRREFLFRITGFLAGLSEPPPVETRLAFQEMDQFSPGEFFHLSYTLRKEHAEPSPQVVLATLKLSDWDPELLVALRQHVTKNLRSWPADVKQELQRGLPRAWRHFFPLHRNFAIELAWLALALDMPEQTVHYGKEAIRLFGESAVALAVVGLAQAMRGEHGPALQQCERALRLDPKNAAALRLQGVLRAGRPAR